MIAGGARAARRWLACAALPYLLSARLARENSGQGGGSRCTKAQILAVSAHIMDAYTLYLGCITRRFLQNAREV